MNTSPRFYTFWSINAPLDQERLNSQLEAFKAHGLDGVVFHPRFYPGQPAYLGEEYMRVVSQTILHARELGLAFWLYDEDGWPSGTVSGQLLKKYPGDAQRWAGLVREHPERCLASFEHGGETWYLSDNTGPGVDYLNPELTRHFIEMTHERYRRGLDAAAFDYVEAFFCDEPELGLGHAIRALPPDGALPWTPRLPELYAARYGEELLPSLPLLFFPGDGAADVRIKFWELVTDLFNEAFTAPLNEWCHRHGKLFTGHVKGEEHPLFQVPTSGSCQQFFRSLSLPGIDALERYPSNNFFPRQVSASARQCGDGRCMVEAFGGSGWGAGPADLERYLLWLGRHGLTDFVLHLSQYRLDSEALLDWPPSEPFHLTWAPAYAEVLGRVRTALARPRPAADTLIISPHRGIMAEYTPNEFIRTNIHNASTHPDTTAAKMNTRFMEQVERLHATGVNYDLADERTVEECAQAESHGLRLGNCLYRYVIASSDILLNAETQALIEPFCRTQEHVSPPQAVVISEHPRQAEPAITLPVEWELVQSPVNALRLECTPVMESEYTASFDSQWNWNEGELTLRFADEPEQVWLDGTELAILPTREGSAVNVPASTRQDGEIRFRLPRPVRLPFVWLEGPFRVASQSPFTTGPAGAVPLLRTDGPFILQAPAPLEQGDLIAGGYPFLRTPLALNATVTLPADCTAIVLGDVEADAVRLSLDGSICRDGHGWSWPQEGCCRFEENFAHGPHKLRLELFPNSYNFYGPHHYRCGDWHVISPGQILGRPNFVDPPDSPPDTRVSSWHFREFRPPTTLSFVPA